MAGGACRRAHCPRPPRGRVVRAGGGGHRAGQRARGWRAPTLATGSHSGQREDDRRVGSGTVERESRLAVIGHRDPRPCVRKYTLGRGDCACLEGCISLTSNWARSHATVPIQICERRACAGVRPDTLRVRRSLDAAAVCASVLARVLRAHRDRGRVARRRDAHMGAAGRHPIRARDGLAIGRWTEGRGRGSGGRPECGRRGKLAQAGTNHFVVVNERIPRRRLSRAQGP